MLELRTISFKKTLKFRISNGEIHEVLVQMSSFEHLKNDKSMGKIRLTQSLLLRRNKILQMAFLWTILHQFHPINLNMLIFYTLHCVFDHVTDAWIFAYKMCRYRTNNHQFIAFSEQRQSIKLKKINSKMKFILFTILLIIYMVKFKECDGSPKPVKQCNTDQKLVCCALSNKRCLLDTSGRRCRTYSGNISIQSNIWIMHILICSSWKRILLRNKCIREYFGRRYSFELSAKIAVCRKSPKYETKKQMTSVNNWMRERFNDTVIFCKIVFGSLSE